MLEMGMEKYPKNVSLTRNLAWIYTNKEQIDDAIPLYEKLITLDGKDKNDFKSIASLYLRNDRRDDAIDSYQQILKLDPKDKDAIKALSTLMQDPAERILMLEKNLANAPEDTEVMFQLAELYYREAEYTSAIKYFKLLLSKRTDDYFAMETLGECYFGLNDYQSAIATYKKIIAAKPDERKYYTDIARNYKELGQLTTARTWARKALAKDRNYGLAYIIIGEIYEVAVEKCMEGSTPKFNDKLVYREAYRQYKRATKDFEFQDKAERKMRYLKDFLPTKEDEFFNKNNKAENGKYKVTNECYKWIATKL